MGSTKRSLKLRIQEYRRAILNGDLQYPMTEHFLEKHRGEASFWLHAIDYIEAWARGGNSELHLGQCESKWICRLRSINQGFNTDHEMHFLLGNA